MTRETKIGLLVGLAFIIVIGVLLSDHLTTRGELPQAQLTQVGANVRVASNVPGSGSPAITPVTVPQDVQVTNPVPTHDELTAKPATAIVQVGPSRTPETAVSVNVGPGAVAQVSGGPNVTVTPTGKEEHVGPTLVAGVTGNPADDMRIVPANQTAPVLTVNMKGHKAEKGDSVSRMAAKYLGGNTTTNRQLIIDANPSLKANPAKVVIGQTYMIPEKGASAASGAKSAETVADGTLLTPSPETTVKTEKPMTEKAVEKTPAATAYTVKSNETLWKIAGGDPATVKEIQDLNKDVLKGKTTIRAGMVLKVPAKTAVASR